MSPRKPSTTPKPETRPTPEIQSQSESELKVEALEDRIMPRLSANHNEAVLAARCPSTSAAT
jgi:hypothetical protein